MTEIIFKLIGGIGLFLMGMVLLTDGLKSFAGDALRRALVRFTGTPLKAFGSGTLVTLMVQSSTATTVTVIGFVSAGLLTFPQAVGVVFGASLGTTGTGWLVSILGLKISLGFYALPLVGIGAFIKLLAQARWKSMGSALAGFGLIFIGIETLQMGMQGLSGIFKLGDLPSTGLWAHVLAMVIGIVMTVIMQSSTAAVATTLTALHTNAINFEQAASLVIGAAIGTTVTGALAAIGGSVPAKRTALAHILFNLATGVIAVVFLPIFLWGIRLAQEHAGLDAGATSLAAFHTAFIALGVAMFLPFVHRFSGMIIRLLPDKGPALTRHLDDTLLSVPAVALEATRRALCDIAGELFAALRKHLENNAPNPDFEPFSVRAALDQTQIFFSQIPSVTEDAPVSQFRVSQMHAIDHLVRLQPRVPPPTSVLNILLHARIQSARLLCVEILALGELGLHGNGPHDWLGQVADKAARLAELRRQERPMVLQEIAAGQWAPGVALEVLDAMRWFDRVCYHAWRLCHYLGENAKN
jgi:phosphate:Na+ symporter